MNLNISMYSEKPIYEQIKEQLKSLVLSGTLKSHEKLPSIRGLSKDLQVGIITVKRAYDDLVNEGFIINQAAKGYYVMKLDIDLIKNEYLKKVEGHIDEIIRLRNEAGLNIEEILELLLSKGGNDDE